MDSSTRSMTATTGRTVLAIVAILSLLLSAFAIARPVIASHGGAHLQESQRGTSWDDASQNENCPEGDFSRIDEGEVLWHFVLTSPVGDSATLTAYFDTDGDGVADLTKTQPSEPREGNGALHFYVVTNEATLIDAQTDLAGGNLVLSHICNEVGAPSIDVTKTGPALSKIGDPTDYTVTITNDGGRMLTITEVSDSLAGDLTAAVVAQCGPLSVGEVCVYQYSYTPLAGATDPLLNTVTVTATDASATAVSDTASASVNLFQPSISVVKTGPATAEVGEEITYTVTITNTSSADSPNLVIDSVLDTLAGDLTAAIVAQCGELSPAEVCAFDYTYTVGESDPDPLDNTVTVETNPAGFPNDIDGSDSHQVDILTPSLTVEKEGPPQSKVGDPTPYTITITNTGELVLTITEVSDSLAGDLTDDVIAECGELAIDEVCEFEYSYTPEADDPDQLVNEVTVTATTAGGNTVNGSDSATVDLFQPDIEVTKEGDVTEAAVGDDVTYTVTIENTSSADSPDLEFDLIDDSLQGDLTDAANYDSSDCGATLAAGDSCTIVYTRTVLESDVSPLVNTVSVESHPEGFPNDIDDFDEFSVVIEEEDEDGSITINKVIDCEECETRTIGYWFNSGGSHDDETNALMAELAAADGGDPALVEVNIDGTVHPFATAQDVRDFVKDDQQGGDGESGLSRDGQLLRQYLATSLNVALNGEECDLASRLLGEQTVTDILLEAEAALAADDEAAEVAAIEKLTAINESDDADENPLTCEGTEATPVDGFTFDLYTEAGYTAGDDPIDSGTTAGGGTLTFEPLPFGTYVIVEVGNDLGLECEVVEVLSGGTLNADGSITVTIDEATPDVTLTVVNECETPGEEEEFGEVEIIKDASDPGEFSFSATWDADGFTLMDGGLEPSGLLEAGSSVTVTETLSAEQLLAGWSLVDIDCGDADVTVEGGSVTITVVANSTITCTFTNELEEQPEDGVLEIDKVFCITSGEADTEFFVFDPTVPEQLGTMGAAEEQPDEGCWTEDVAFTITGGDLTEPVQVMTGDDGIIEVDLPESENAYVLTEDLSGESAEFWIEDGAITVVLVVNWIPEEAENGTLKVIKLFCETDDAAEAGVAFQVEGGDVAVPVLQGCTVGDATFELGDDTFSVGADGLAILTVEVGEYDFAEIAPNAAVYAGTVPVVEGEYTTVIVYNTFVEDEQGGGGGGVTPGQSQTPREGTAGGNPLPNTATTPAPGGSLPAILLALTALGALAVGGQRMAAEARRRR